MLPFFLIARGCHSLASTMLVVSLGWHLYEFSGDPLDLAFVGLAQILPVFLFFFASGWAVDHFSRERLVKLCLLVDLICFSAMGWIMLEATINTAWIYALVFVQGASKAFASPAMQAIVPNIVEKSQLNRAIAMTSTTWNFAMTIGPAIAGLLILWLDRGVYFVITGCAVVGLIAISRLPRIKPAGSQKRSWDDLYAGLRLVFNNPILLGSLSLDLLIVGLGSVLVLLPIYATDIFQVGPEDLGIMRAMPGIGSVLMGLYMSKRAELTKAGAKLLIALTVFSLSIATFALTDSYWIALAALFIYGASDMVSVNIRMTLVQLATPDELRGRVSAVNSLFIATSNEAGDFRGGATAAAIGPVATATVGAGLALAITLWGYKTFPTLFKLDRVGSVKPS